MFRQVHHMGIVVDDLDKARAVLGKGWGLKVNEDRTPGPDGALDPTLNAHVLEFPLGQGFIRAIKPAGDGPIAKYMEDRPNGGAHHISLVTDTPEFDVTRLLAGGVKFWLPPDKKDWDGKSPVYFDPETTGGLVLQLWPDDGYAVSPQYQGEGVFSKIHHCGVGAQTLDKAKQFWVQTVGCSVDERRSPAATGRSTGREYDPNVPASDPVTILDMPVGQTEVEVSVPKDMRSGTGRFVERFATQGFAIHHICPYAPDVERAVAVLNERGLTQIGALPEEVPGRSRVAWYHPRSVLGVLMEIWHDVPYEV